MAVIHIIPQAASRKRGMSQAVEDFVRTAISEYLKADYKPRHHPSAIDEIRRQYASSQLPENAFAAFSPGFLVLAQMSLTSS